jgi:hypothetical protein
MNFVFVLFDDRAALRSLASFSISDFPVDRVGYWALLLLPFVIVPPVAIFSRRLLENKAREIAELLPEFRVLDYLFVTCTCYIIVILAMYRADAWGLLWAGSDAISSVWARFELLDRLNAFERALLQSVLVFLTLYSLVRALRSRTLVWFSFFVVNLIAMSILLALLNMKWPVVVLFGGVVTSTALFGKHRLVYSAVGAVGMVCVYMLIATIVLRIPQSFKPGDDSAAVEAVRAAASSAPARGRTVDVTVKGTIAAAASSSDRLWTSGLIRMALPYPFYYQTFTTEGPVCGTILDRLQRRRNPCQPSTLIYERMFRNDGFAGIGTAPAAFHITGYALDGWMGAIVETVLVGIVIGGFMALPLNASAVSGTAIVMGVLAAYFYSQLPFEGPLVYDHGVLWWLLLIFGYTAVRHLGIGPRFRSSRHQNANSGKP